MVEFAQHDLASQVLARDELTPRHIDTLASKVAAFHATIAGARPPPACGTPEAILSVALANFEPLTSRMGTAAGRTSIRELEAWTRREHVALAPAFRARRKDGFVRECHGDLHLGNIAVIHDDPVIFDCIEFNDALRWIDVLNEIAFTVMDLQERGHPGLAHRFLNAYLEHTGDYGGLPVLRFYLVYRALVRAKIAQLRAGQMSPGRDRDTVWAERDDYVRQACNYARPPAPAIAITHGLSGCGKTTLSGILLERIGAVRIRTDVERKRNFDIPSAYHPTGVEKERLYSAEATQQTYERVQQLACHVLAAGFVVIVDGAFLQRRHRDRFRTLAGELGVPFVVIAFAVNANMLRARIVERHRQGNDASDADLAVLERQLQSQEAFEADEASSIVGYDAGRPLVDARSAGAWGAVLVRLAPCPRPKH
jgi:predicted kinase